LEGTKIGGIPRFIQAGEPPDGKFIASFGSLIPTCFAPYPLVNQIEPLESYLSPGELVWGDAGCLYFSMNDDGSVNWGYGGY
jgi:hypothetical protein